MFEIIPEETEEICKYCGEKAKYYLNKKKIPCCSNSVQKCPEVKNNNTKGLVLAHKREDSLYNDEEIRKTFGWSRGLTKETSNSLKKQSNTLKERLLNGTIKPSFLGKKHSEETRKKWKENPNMGGLRKGSGRGKKGWYKEFYCRSTWELAWLVYQLDSGIKVDHCHDTFEYEFEGEKHKYYPDFMIGEDYIEIKGFRYPNTKEKINQFPKDKKLIMIEGKKEIKPYLEYVEEKYGKEFWKVLYEER